MKLTYYEVHAEHDGHVAGSWDEEYAEELVEQYNEEHHQDHYIKEVQE